MDNGLISRADAIDEAEEWIEAVYCGHDEQRERDAIKHVINGIKKLPSAQPESTRTFVELVVEYPDPELCTYKEYRWKPYYSIKYIENGEAYIGYGTYKPEVLSQYLKEYFISSAQPEGTCESCLHQELEWDEEPCDGCTVGGDTKHYKPSMGRRTDERTD